MNWKLLSAAFFACALASCLTYSQQPLVSDGKSVGESNAIAAKDVFGEPLDTIADTSVALLQQPLAETATIAKEEPVGDHFTTRTPNPKFRRALLSAAEQAHKDGSITRWELARLRMVTFRPVVLAEIEDCCLSEAVAQGKVNASSARNPAAIDWMAFLDFLKALIPLIMDIINMFLAQLHWLMPADGSIMLAELLYEAGLEQQDLTLAV